MTERSSRAHTDPAAGWDCHVHVFETDAPLPPDAEPAQQPAHDQPAHYRPAHRPLAAIEALAAAERIGHLVLVQPSVYGCDNRLLLQALAREPGRHRGIVVPAPEVTEAELEAMHALGVRGIRYNLVSPVGLRDEQGLARLAPMLRRLGWHVQWYVQAQQLPRLAALQRDCGLRFVFDHLAGMTAPSAALPDPDDPGRQAAWAALAELAAGGAWVKLSGWYRLQAEPPYAALDGTIRRMAQLFGARLVWGSDWPHTSFAPGTEPAYATTWAPVPRALGAAAAATLRQSAPVALYR